MNKFKINDKVTWSKEFLTKYSGHFKGSTGIIVDIEYGDALDIDTNYIVRWPNGVFDKVFANHLDFYSEPNDILKTLI